jgi:hypothetical protein
MNGFVELLLEEDPDPLTDDQSAPAVRGDVATSFG